MPCPFCDPSLDTVAATPLAFAIRDAAPVAPGHMLVIPRRHVDSYFACDDVEKRDLWRLVDTVQQALVAEFRPDGFNVGVNVGVAAGQTVLHCHVHVIPRFAGDTPDPTGGVRGVIPSRVRPIVTPAGRGPKSGPA